ncbi:hypothetical protein FXN63_12575 [Pigmentiphaga aceris]|uniref:Translation elongation factor EFTu-like domain-containing protein n=1 Tax=Pigmentiphaga aceris TaxID=1940612 RepID=A0A5C0B1E2_9BURK|nr:EF-Tu/IF-2/RF-3 family GTPase [Pigmentiphaga aceris]QEI06571.1 hypothetical protein FXN63_12575 [Pigmentiphaga aceris]
MKDNNMSMTPGNRHSPDLIDDDLRMTIDDVFHITGRGVVAVGKIESGFLAVGDEIEIRHNGLAVAQTFVVGIEMFRKLVDEAAVGDHVGLLLSDVKIDQLKRGMVVGWPGAASASFNGMPAKPVTVDGVPVTTTFNTTASQFSSVKADETVDRLSNAAASAADHKDFTKGEEFRGLGFTDDSTPGHVGSPAKAIKRTLIALVLVAAAAALAANMMGLI